MDDSIRPQHKTSIDVVETDDGIVIQHDDLIYTLNATAKEVYYLCNGDKSISEVIETMVSLYGSDEKFGSEGVEKLVRECIDILYSNGLITSS